MNKRIKYILIILVIAIIILVIAIGFAAIAALCNLISEGNKSYRRRQIEPKTVVMEDLHAKEKEISASHLLDDTVEQRACKKRNEEKTGDSRSSESSYNVSEKEGGDAPDTFLDKDTKALLSTLWDRSMDEEKHRSALNLLLEKAEKEEDRNFAFRVLMEAKDALVGEELQTLLKRLHGFADIGGNEALMEEFFRTEGAISSLERLRILSYINGSYPLDKRNTDRLGNSYLSTEDKDLRRGLLNGLANVCGEQGISLIADLIDTEKEEAEQRALVDALSNSGSRSAFELLHKLINTEKDPKKVDHLRAAILRMKRDN